MNITLRQLEVFCAIARRSNVSRAAEDVCISQSAASMALAELERHLGAKLFDRLGRKLSLNTNGRMLFSRATDLLARAQEVEGLFEAGSTGAGSTLEIGASSTIGNYLMPGVLGDFSAAYPNVHVTLQVGNTEQIIQALLDCEIELGFIEGSCREPNIESRAWRDDELIVVAGPDHPLTCKTSLTRRDLFSADWILRERGSGTREMFERAIAGRVRSLNVRYELGHTEAVKQAVKNHLGVSCLSRLTVQDELAAGSLVELAAPFLSLRRQLYLLLRKGKFETAGMNCFIDFAGGASITGDRKRALSTRA